MHFSSNIVLHNKRKPLNSIELMKFTVENAESIIIACSYYNYTVCNANATGNFLVNVDAFTTVTRYLNKRVVEKRFL